MIYIAVVFIASISSINTINLYFINKIEEHYNIQIDRLKDEKYVFPGNIYPDLEKEDLNQLYSKYNQLILLWESVLTFSSMMLFYLILSRQSQKERKYREFLELTILAISHKFGNFLSAMRVNLELIKSTNSPKQIQLMEDYISKMDEDTKTILHLLKRGFEENVEFVKIGNKVEEILTKMNIKDKKVIKNLKNYHITADINILENVLYILLHNSQKYSKSFIHIKITNKKLIVIRNDINLETIDRGSGIGLVIAERLCRLTGWKMKIKKSGEYFTVFVCF